MRNFTKSFIRMIAYILIFVGICSIWEIVDVATYGESQHSCMDLIAAILMASWLDWKVWGDWNA